MVVLKRRQTMLLNLFLLYFIKNLLGHKYGAVIVGF